MMQQDKCQQLFELQLNKNTGEFNITLKNQVLQQIKRNYDPKKKIAIICAAGTMGAGKSTLLNSIIMTEGGYNMDKEYFQTCGNSIQSVTNGMWVNVHPIPTKNDPETQLMIIDLEGQGAIKEGDQQLLEECLKKIYILGLILSSSFIICCSCMRPQQGEMQQLKDMCDIIESISKDYGIVTPQITMFLKNGQKLDESQIFEFKNLLKSQLDFSDNILKEMKIRPAYTLPIEFTQGKNKDYSIIEMEADDYIDEITDYLQNEGILIKKSLGNGQDYQNVLGLVELVEKSYQGINSKWFKSFIVNNLEQLIYQTGEPIIQENIEQLQQQYKILSLETPTEINEKQFSQLLDKKVENLEKNFISNIKKLIFRADPKTSEATQNLIKTLQSRVKQIQNEAEMNFLKRRVEAAQNEKDKQHAQEILSQKEKLSEEHQKEQKKMLEKMSEEKKKMEKKINKLLKQSEEKQLKLQQELENQRKESQKQFEIQQQQYKEEIEKLDKKNTKEVQELKRQSEEKLAKLQQEQMENDKQYKKDIENLRTNHENQLKQQDQVMQQQNQHLRQQIQDMQRESENRISEVKNQLQEAKEEIRRQEKQSQSRGGDMSELLFLSMLSQPQPQMMYQPSPMMMPQSQFPSYDSFGHGSGMSTNSFQSSAGSSSGKQRTACSYGCGKDYVYQGARHTHESSKCPNKPN